MNRKLLIIASVVAVLTALTVTPAYAAGIVVNTNADATIAGDGFCSLREAITNANSDSDTTGGDCPAGSGADAITFAANYTITLAGSQLPAVTTVITITGNGAANTIIQTNAAPYTASYRVFEVSGGGNLTLDSLTIQNGYCIVLCNTNADSGGGIYNAGTLTVSNVTFSGNSASIGGGMFNDHSSPTLTNVTVSANSATNGGGMFNYYSSPTLTDVTFSANSATTNGGGMYNAASSPTLTNVTFSANSANSSGGGMYNSNSNPTLTNVIFSGNLAPDGGGIYNYFSSPTLTNVIFSTNSAGRGGGMYNDQSYPTLTNVTFSDNSATTYGGGMNNYYSSPTLMNVTFSGNSAGAGGGMYNYFFSSPALTDVTFSTNSATTDGGGMYNENSSSPTLTNVTLWGNSAGSGGGMYNLSSSPQLTNVTVSLNSADFGGGMFNFGSSPTLTNVILWGDTATSGLEIYNLFSTPSISYSVVEGGCPAGSTCTAIINTNPVLGLLQDNGGFTQTMALGTGSPAIDAGTNTGCPATDQRGVTRPQGAACDIGAYEVEVDSNPPTVTPTNTPTGTPTDTPTATPIPPTETPTNTPTDTPTPTPAGFGCSPGFWKNHTSLWPAPYLPIDKVVVVFSDASTYPNSIQDATLLQALSFTGGTNINGAAKILLRAGVAALLNAQSGFGYPLTKQEVIDDVNEALATHNRATMLALAKTLDGYNNGLCPLPVSGRAAPGVQAGSVGNNAMAGGSSMPRTTTFEM